MMPIQKLKILAIAAGLLGLSGCGWFHQDEKPLLAAVPPQTFADAVLVIKHERRMILYSHGQPFRVYNVAIGLDPIGPKIAQGDGKTPEGTYFIDYRKPNSSFHKALHISYPNETDIARARAYGVNPGGGIMIHGVTDGEPYDHYAKTFGCIAVTNPEIEEIWNLVPDHTRVEIRA